MQIFFDTAIINHLTGISLGIFWIGRTEKVAMDTLRA